VKRLRGIAAIVAAGAFAATALAGPADMDANPLAEAHSALQSGEASRALNLLQTAPQAGPEAADARNLECRVRFTLQQWSAAAKACAQAVRMDGQNSDYHMWLGRALGQQAGAASFLSAYSLSKQARQEMETAVRLNPRNAAALSDLGEFYVEAPSIVGGGLDKAQSVSEELDRIDRARAAELRGRIAYARKDYGAAEQDY
jgi:cytochrome c-type biogenesis protein CcmH/NrfG